ncbi:hypothetical protein ACKFKG_00330 [Phormidesmis sp. 146-35]
MQKLVTIYLDREGYRIPGKRSPEQSHGTVQEHLEDYLAAGWEIKSITGAGGGGAGDSVNPHGSGWIAVLLEKL